MFKVTLGCVVSLRPAWATVYPVIERVRGVKSGRKGERREKE